MNIIILNVLIVLMVLSHFFFSTWFTFATTTVATAETTATATATRQQTSDNHTDLIITTANKILLLGKPETHKKIDKISLIHSI